MECIEYVSFYIYFFIFYYFTLYSVIAIIGISSYYFTACVLSTPVFAAIFNNELTFKIFDILHYFRSWIFIVVFPFIVILPDLAFTFVRKNYYPTPSDIILHKEAYYRNPAKTIFENKGMIDTDIVKVGKYVLNKNLI